MRATLLGVMIVVGSATAGAQEDFSYARRLYLDKAQCSYCHGWAGDGAGEGQSNGGAANLRRSQLARDQLLMVISCGIPGTPMPHFDELAYTDTRCYGQTEAELGTRTPSLPPSTMPSVIHSRKSSAWLTVSGGLPSIATPPSSATS